LAKFLWFVSILINDDFPTLDRPIKAYSGKKSFGHLSTSELLTINSAVLIFMIVFVDSSLKLSALLNGYALTNLQANY